MISLRSDNRVLVSNSKFTYLTDNCVSGVNSLTVVNPDQMAVGNPILLGEIGHSDAEIFIIATLDQTTGTFTINDSTGAKAYTEHPHPESTKVTILAYNQIRFYWTAATGTIADEAPVFNALNPLTGYLDLDPSSYYSTYTDTTHPTGFGWFEYLNSITNDLSQESNPIPFVGFSENTALSVFNDFESMLNVNELKLVSVSDKFSWFNEGLVLIKNKLNLNNDEYFLSIPQTLNVIAGTAEYALQPDFCDLVEISDASAKLEIPYTHPSKVLAYNLSYTSYYIRGRYIGFVPTPGTNTTYKYTYRSKSTRVTSLSTYIDLPDNMFYAIKDWMLYRAYLKFANPLAASCLSSFNATLDTYIISSAVRSADLDVWDIASNANT